MFSTPPETEPVSFHYFIQLDTFLRRTPGSLNEDLATRARSAAALARETDGGTATTRLRVRWCCYTAANELLHLLEQPSAAIPLFDELTFERLEALDKVAEQIVKNVLVEQAEYSMADLEGQRGAGQVGFSNRKRLERVLALFRETLGYAKTYLQGIRSAAGTVSGTFFYLLEECNVDSDHLIELGETLAAVHA